MVTGIRNSIHFESTLTILYAAKINDKVCPIVKSEINHITFFQFPNSYTTANAIKNNIWS